MHRHAGRLVDHDQRIVFPGYLKIPWRNSRLRWSLGSSQRRYPHFVADLQPILGRHTPLVYPHLAAAHDAIDVALRHALGDAQQEIVDALALGLLADFKPRNRIFA